MKTWLEYRSGKPAIGYKVAATTVATGLISGDAVIAPNSLFGNRGLNLVDNSNDVKGNMGGRLSRADSRYRAEIQSARALLYCSGYSSLAVVTFRPSVEARVIV